MNDRPYEPTGMTTARWREITPSRVLIASLVRAQPLDAALLDGPDTSYCGDPFPHAVLWNGELWLSDGNHRVARAERRGAVTAMVRVAMPLIHFMPFRAAA
jgi:hypothetical protein